MKSRQFQILTCGVLAFGFSAATFAANDPLAPVVKLRKDTCLEGAVTLDNCFTTPSSLTAWLASTRKPTSDNPLRIEVGPGTFPRININCAANGYTGFISIVGAGRLQTIFRDDSINSTASGVIKVTSCTNMNFSDLGVASSGYNYIVWSGGGVSTWTNVDVNTPARSWTEVNSALQCTSGTPGSHYWFSSRLNVNTVFTVGQTYAATCDKSWFYGSELVLTQHGTVAPPPGANNTVLRASGNGEIHVYGSNIKVTADSSSGTAGGTFYAAQAVDNGSIHIHGTGIDMLSTSPASVDFITLQAASGGMIHANVSAYNFNNPIGSVTRISNSGGHIHAPYLWEHTPNPTTVANFASETGADMTTLASGTSDGHPHLAIYDASCASKWYDAVDKACKP